MSRHTQLPTVPADRFADWVHLKGHKANTVEKDIMPEESVNGRQPTAVIWSPGYVFHAKAQTSVMGSNLRVRLYECTRKHESCSENSPPNPDFWRELVSLSSGHEVGNEDNASYCCIHDVHVTDDHNARRNHWSQSLRSARGREDSSPGDKRSCRPCGTHSADGVSAGTKNRRFLEMSKTGSYMVPFGLRKSWRSDPACTVTMILPITHAKRT